MLSRRLIAVMCLALVIGITPVIGQDKSIVVASTTSAQDSGLFDYILPPEKLDTPGKRALYNNLNKDETLALKIDETVRWVRPNAFRGNQAKENVIKTALLPLLGKDRAEVERIFMIIKAQKEY